MRKSPLLALAVLMTAVTPALGAPITDGALGHFVGHWRITGVTRGKDITTGAEVQSRFKDTFLELHIKDPSGRAPYEALVYFGQDQGGGLVIHWLDATGGETSLTLGRGKVSGDHAAFDFAYPDGEFRDQLDYDAAHDRWRLLIETGPKTHPAVFSDWRFERLPER